MIVVNFKDGTTLKFNLNRQDDYNQWLEWSSVHDFQEKVTGVGIIHNRKFIAMPLPSKFKKCKFYAELVHTKNKRKEKVLQGERLTCHADDVKLSLLVYTYTTDPPPPVLCKFTAEKIGRQVFSGENFNIGRIKNGSNK